MKRSVLIIVRYFLPLLILALVIPTSRTAIEEFLKSHSIILDSENSDESSTALVELDPEDENIKDKRQIWMCETGLFKYKGDGEWIEESIELDKHHYEETERTNKFIELVDDSRDLTLRLTASVLEEQSDADGEDWKVAKRGRWK